MMAVHTVFTHAAHGITQKKLCQEQKTQGVYANVVDYHAHSGVTSMHSAQAPPPGTAARASLAYFSKKLEHPTQVTRELHLGKVPMARVVVVRFPTALKAPRKQKETE